MTTFTKPQLKALRETMQKALDEVNIEGISITVGNCTFGEGEANFKVKALLEGGKTKEQKDLEDAVHLYALDIDKVSSLQGMMVKLVGYKAKAYKRPWIVATSPEGSRYVIDDNTAKRLFGIVSEV
jgi:hypothetical protein